MEVVRRTRGEDFGLTKSEIEERARKAEAEKANDEMEVIHVEEEAQTMVEDPDHKEGPTKSEEQEKTLEESSTEEEHKE